MHSMLFFNNIYYPLKCRVNCVNRILKEKWEVRRWWFVCVSVVLVCILTMGGGCTSLTWPLTVVCCGPAMCPVPYDCSPANNMGSSRDYKENENVLQPPLPSFQERNIFLLPHKTKIIVFKIIIIIKLHSTFLQHRIEISKIK